MRPGDYDESDVRVRSGRGSRPRTKTRPEHADAAEAMVVTVDRGRFTLLVGDETVTAMKARQLGRRGVVVGEDSTTVSESRAARSIVAVVRLGSRPA